MCKKFFEVCVALETRHTHTHIQCRNVVLQLFFSFLLSCDAHHSSVLCDMSPCRVCKQCVCVSSVRDVTGLGLIHCRIAADDGARFRITAAMPHARLTQTCRP